MQRDIRSERGKESEICSKRGKIARERKESLREIEKETKKRKKYERNMQRERHAVREEEKEICSKRGKKERYAVRGEKIERKKSVLCYKK